MATNSDITNALVAAKRNYFKLVLLVGLPDSGKTTLLTSFSKASGLPVHNVNLHVSSSLLDLTERQRMTHATSVFFDLVSDKNGPVLLDNTEIIFDKTLPLDPIRLLTQLAKNVPVVATWSGKYLDGKLSYAIPFHPEYRSIDEVDAVIVNMEAS